MAVQIYLYIIQVSCYLCMEIFFLLYNKAKEFHLDLYIKYVGLNFKGEAVDLVTACVFTMCVIMPPINKLKFLRI